MKQNIQYDELEIGGLYYTTHTSLFDFDEVLSISCDAREIAKTDIKNRFSGLTKDETINLLAKKLYLELEAYPDEYGDKDRQLGVMDFLNEEFIKNKWWNLLVDKDRG